AVQVVFDPDRASAAVDPRRRVAQWDRNGAPTVGPLDLRSARAEGDAPDDAPRHDPRQVGPVRSCRGVRGTATGSEDESRRGGGRASPGEASTHHPRRRRYSGARTAEGRPEPPFTRLLGGARRAGRAASAAASAPPLAVAARTLLRPLARRRVLRPLDQLLRRHGVPVLVLLDQLEPDPAARLVDLLDDDVERVAALDHVLDVAD